MGYYCPRANTDPEALKKNTPKERVAPTPPEAPAGVALMTGAMCPKLDDGKRAPCKEGLCCGQGTLSTDQSNTVDQCMENNITTFDEAGETWNFVCYESASRIMMTLGTIMASVGLLYI